MLVGCIRPALAHDLWIQPSTFVVPEGASVQVALRVGHEDDVRQLALPTDRVVRFEVFSPGVPGPRPLASLSGQHNGQTSEQAAAGSTRLSRPGVHTLVYQSRPKYIELDSKSFAGYLEHEGLDAVLAERVSRDEVSKVGKERYGRYCKALVRVGSGSNGFDRKVGLPMEIVAVTDPFVQDPKGTLRFKLLFRSAPLPDARVDLLRLDDLRQGTARRSDESGEVVFPAPDDGAWMVAVTHMIRAETVESLETARSAEPADWESFWATLSFDRIALGQGSKSEG